MTLDAAKPKHRYVALDSLRGICACMVVLYHFSGHGYLGELMVVQNSFLFVDFFFVLSGFVIGWSYGPRLAEGFSVPRFMWLRLGRVYPLHFVMLLVFIVFEVGFALFAPDLAGRVPFTGTYTIEGLVASFFALQIFIGPDATWNAPAWSIAAEIWTYLIFALLLRYLPRWIVPIGVAIAAVAIALLPSLSGHYMNAFHEGALLRCLYGFALGIIGWKIMPALQRVSLGGRWIESLIELAMVALIVVFVSFCAGGPISLAAPIVFFLAVMTFARERGMLSKLLKTGPFVLVGTLSYSIYMIHWFMLWRYLNLLALLDRMGVLDLRRINPEPGDMIMVDAITLVFLVVVIACAYVSYRLIEQPGQALARRLVGQRRSG